MKPKIREYPKKELLRELFDYDIDTGNLIRKTTVSSRKGSREGDIAGTPVGFGYRVIRINYNRYLQHRLVYIWHNGDIPEGYHIDHIDNNTSNNRIDNLQILSHRENNMKRRIPINNTSGYMGVVWDKRKKKWSARMSLRGKFIFLGYFLTPEEADKARQKANANYGFHENHGKTHSDRYKNT